MFHMIFMLHVFYFNGRRRVYVYYTKVMMWWFMVWTKFGVASLCYTNFALCTYFPRPGESRDQDAMKRGCRILV